jgi:hypothetical protein
VLPSFISKSNLSAQAVDDYASDDEVLLPGKASAFKLTSISRTSITPEGETTEDEILRDYIENIRNAGVLRDDLDAFPLSFANVNLETPESQLPPKRERKDSTDIAHEIKTLATSLGRLTSEDHDFDVTDFEKYSTPGRRRKKGDLPVLATISDDELRDNMRSSWARDREKKKLRRELKEEFRQQGLHGKETTAEFDLRQKYPSLMRLFEIKEEFVDFFNRADQTFVLFARPEWILMP